MKRTIGVWLGWMIVAGPVAWGQQTADAPAKEPPEKNEAIEIIKRADNAIKAVKLVKYKGRLEPTGWVAQRVPSMEGTAVIGGGFGTFFQKFRVDLEVRRGEDEKVSKYTAGGDGKTFYLIDPQKKTVYENTKPTALGFVRSWVRIFGMAEFVHPTPFDDEINADKVELRGREKVNGEECYVIHVVYAGGSDKKTEWYISTKDYLPRRADRIVVDPAIGPGVSKLILTDLVVNPKVDENTFKLVVPDGFEKTEESAPSGRVW